MNTITNDDDENEGKELKSATVRIYLELWGVYVVLCGTSRVALQIAAAPLCANIDWRHSAEVHKTFANEASREFM